MSLSDAEFGHLFNKLETEGGFSVNPNTGKPPSSGIMVGQIGSGSTSPVSETTPDTIKDYEQSKSWSRQDDYMGGWRSAGSGRDAFDVSRNVRGKPTIAASYGPDVARADARTSAEDLALYNNQDAIYDVDTGKDPDTMGVADMRKVTGLKSEETPSYMQESPQAFGLLRPERLTGAQMDAESPGWTDRAYERAQRRDGGNG